MRSVNPQGIERLHDFKPKNAIQEFDARVFAAANYTGPSLRMVDPVRQFLSIDEVLVTVSLMNNHEPIKKEAIQLVVEAIVENFGHLTPAEIKLAMVSALLGKVDGAPKTYQKMNLEWIGGVLSAYDELRGACISRTRYNLPELPDNTEGRNKEAVEMEFFNLMASAVNEQDIPPAASRILPEILYLLEEWIEENLGGILKICDKRRIEIFNVATDIIKSKDERAAKYNATKHDYFNAVLLSNKKDKTKGTRTVLLAKEIACRELIGHMKKYGFRIPVMENQIVKA